MKALIIGSGGREHALAWKLAQSPLIQELFISPGNGGTISEAKCQNLVGADPTTVQGQNLLVDLARREAIDLTIVGPEAPLAAGIVDVFRAAGLAIVGPDRSAAQLEASKAFAKDFMARNGVRCAASQRYDALGPALEAVAQHFSQKASPLVVKADGLAAGKGVVVAETKSQAENSLRAFMTEGSLGPAGKIVVLEDCLRGQEVSVLAAVSVKAADVASAAILPFVAARDHKRRFEAGRGPNTGGMGAIAPVPDFDEQVAADFQTAILEPTLRGLVAEGFDYRGFLFFGLMVDDKRCSLLEYNVRLGDPETQAVLPLLKTDLAELCLAIIDSRLKNFNLAWQAGAVCAPVVVAEGYPGPYSKGQRIEIDEALMAPATLFQAGTARVNDETGSYLVTSGGRVAAVAALAANAEAAFQQAYQAIKGINFQGMGFRRDIGQEIWPLD